MIDRENIIKLLIVIRSISRDASLTGSLEKGSKYMIRVYNELLNMIKNQKMIPNSIILSDPLSENASIDELGCAVSLLVQLINDSV